MTPFATKLAAAVFGGDLLFGVIRAWQLLSREEAGNWFRLDEDGSLPELFQYVKFVVIAALAARLAVATGLRWYLLWAVGFTYLMLDDSLMLHERLAEALAPRLVGMLPSGADPQDIAELGYFAVVIAVILAFAVIGMAASPGPFRRLSLDVIVLLAIGAVFAVGIDVIHGLLTLDYVGDNLFIVVEDGGEMIVVSLIAVYWAMATERVGMLNPWLTDVRRPFR